MSSLREYLAEIGAEMSHRGAHLRGIPADTTAAAQAIQDALQRRLSPAEKLAPAPSIKMTRTPS